MSTFIEIVNAVERESGTVSGGLKTADVTAPATDRQNKIVNWVNTAWELIQSSRNDWEFLVGEFQKTLTIGKRRYTPAELTMTRFSNWLTDADGYMPLSIYETALGTANENELRLIDFVHWREAYDRGATQQTRPTCYAISRSRELCFGDTPDKAYTIRGEYRKTPQVLAVNSDVPDCPVEYHQVIIWRALMLLGDHDEAPITIAAAQAKMNTMFSSMVQRCTPSPSLKGNDGYFS